MASSLNEVEEEAKWEVPLTLIDLPFIFYGILFFCVSLRVVRNVIFMSYRSYFWYTGPTFLSFLSIDFPDFIFLLLWHLPFIRLVSNFPIFLYFLLLFLHSFGNLTSSIVNPSYLSSSFCQVLSSSFSIYFSFWYDLYRLDLAKARYGRRDIWSLLARTPPEDHWLERKTKTLKETRWKIFNLLPYACWATYETEEIKL